MRAGRPWYEEAFGRHYLSVYAHRDEESAGREAEFARRVMDLRAGDRVLDLACGAGRHSRALAAAGLTVIGLDLSADLLAAAAARGPPPPAGPAWVRGDMRRLPLSGPFEGILLFFTSFGYFETEAEDAAVLAEVARVLVPGGRVLLDFPNRDRVVEGLVPESVEERGGRTVRSRRRMSADGRRVLKTVRIECDGRLETEYTESVRLYSPREVEVALAGAGLSVAGRFGGLDGAPFGPESDRLVVVATC